MLFSPLKSRIAHCLHSANFTVPDAMRKLIFAFSFISQLGFSQDSFQNKADSLKKLLQTRQIDSLYFVRTDMLCSMYATRHDMVSMKNCIENALRVAEQSKKKSFIGWANYLAGTFHKENENLVLAQKHFLEALKQIDHEHYKLICSNCYSYLGFIQEGNNNTKKAIEYHLEALRIRKGLSERLTLTSYSRLGATYEKAGKYDSSLYYMRLALCIIKNNDVAERSKTGIYTNYGLALLHFKKYDSCVYYTLLTLPYYESTGDYLNLAGSTINLGTYFEEMKNFKKAGEYYLKGLEYAKKAGFNEWIMAAYSNLSRYYYTQRDYKIAFDYLTEANKIKDTLLNETKIKEITDAEERYQSDKKAQALAMSNMKLKMQEMKLNMSHSQRNYLIVGLCVALILFLFAFFAYRKMKLLSKTLETKNKEINLQKDIIEEKNKNITDSIHYAKRIQTSLLPGEKYLEKYLKNK
jgi:tetratricopeptide (TPR) repeat protein